MAKKADLLAVDMFCGAGGASTGLVRACDQLGLKLWLLAINHWPTAVQTHLLNHPGVQHRCEAIERIDPRAEVPGGRLDLLLAGPECTHFSTARGGRPVNPQSRASAWNIAKWAQELYIDTILIENVPEFRTWGPVGADGKPLKSKKGETFAAFLDVLRSLGYKVEVKILNAADYGDPTTRQRLFIIARRRKAITWPKPSHSKTGASTLFGTTKRWKAAREIIDWSIAGKSIFNRKKPLKPATIARIMAGLEKFGGKELAPFLVILRNNQTAQSIDGPVPTLTTSGANVGIAEPLLSQRDLAVIGAIDPFIVPVNHGEGDLRSNSIEGPMPTLTARANQYLVEPMILGQQSGSVARPASDPLPTVATDGAIALVEPFLVTAGGPIGQGRTPNSIEEPVPTVLGENHRALVEPMILSAGGPNCPARPVSEPLGTVLTRDHRALVEPFLSSYYGTLNISPVTEPVPTVTTKDRFGLVMPVINGLALDIRFRMLQPHELSAAMSFPKEYKFSGKREDVVKQIGNSWPGELSFALNLTIARDYVPKKRRKPEEAEALEAIA
jgi:DNA (cytosine-5)-methyltransferase 1